MACTVAPSSESKREPPRPAREISGKSNQLPVNRAAGNAIRQAPNSDAKVPHNEIPPEVPFSTRFFKSVIMRGGVGFRTPSSVAHVSALTAASAAAKPTQGRIDSGYNAWSAANRLLPIQ